MTTHTTIRVLAVSVVRQEAGARGGLPAVGLKLATLVQRLQVSV